MDTVTYEEAGWMSIPRAIARSAWRRDLVAVAGGSAFVGATAIVLWLASGVRAGEIARYVPYELGFVFLPGWLVYRALTSDRGGLRELVFGWTLGYLLEPMAFLITAAAGVRGLFVVYPAVVGIPATFVLWRRSGGVAPTGHRVSLPRISIVLGAVLSALLLLYAAAVFFTQMPLPRSLGVATYQEDTVFVISIASEVLHHWPFTLPMVSGQSLHYQVFPFLHMAAITQVTGIDLSVVVMRLYQVPLLMLLVLQLVLAGRRVGRFPFVGLSAAFLVLFFGELDPTHTGFRFLFDDFFFYWLLYSHTFLFGLVFFFAAVILLCDLIDPDRPLLMPRWAAWSLVAAFLVGSTGSKPYALIEAAGGLVVLLAWQLWRRRTVNRAAVWALGLCAVIQITANAIVFKWTTGGEFVRPFKTIEQMAGVGDLAIYLHRMWNAAGAKPIVAVPYGTLGLLAIPIVGILLWLWLNRGNRVSVSQAWFLSLFVAVAAPFFLLSQPGLGQFFVVFFGVVPGTVLASIGYRELLALLDRRALRVALVVLAVSVVTVAVVATLAKTGERWVGLQLTLLWLLAFGAALASPRLGRLRLPTAAVALLGLVVFGTPLVSLVRGTSSMPRARGAIALLIALAAVTALAFYVRRRPRASLGVVGATVGGLLVLGILNTPLDWFPDLVQRARAGQPLYSQQNRGLTAGLYSGLLWIRNHSSPNEVLVVNNHSLDPEGRDSKYFYYSAFAQRRVFLESWDYTPQTAARHVFSLDLANSPFPYRLKLSNAVFDTADTNAIRTLVQHYSARYAVVDKVHQAPSPALEQRVKPAFSNSDVDIYDLRAALLASQPSASSFSCTSQQGAGITAIFGRARTLTGAYALAHEAAGSGFQGLTVQRRGCHSYAVALTGLSGLVQATDLKREAAKVRVSVQIECRSRAPSGTLAAVFGHRRTEAAARVLRLSAARLGFQGLQVEQDRCNDWEVALYGLQTASQRRGLSREAAKVGLHVAFEPG